MKRNQRPSEPMFNFSEKVPAYLGGVLIVIFAFITVLPASLDRLFGLYGMLRPLNTPGTDGLSNILSVVGHGFLHGSWSHVLMNTGMIIIFGIATIRGIKTREKNVKLPAGANVLFLIIFLVGVVVGGVFQWGWWSLSSAVNAAAVGASGGASALFATTGWAIGGREKMLQFGLGWTVINIIMVAAEPVLGVGLAWAAHIGGYVGGMIVAPLWVAPKSTKMSMT